MSTNQDSQILEEVQKLLEFLSPPLLQGVRSYRKITRLNEVQILELVIAKYLNLDVVSFGKVEDYKSPREILEELENIRVQMSALNAFFLEEPEMPAERKTSSLDDNSMPKDNNN